MTALLPPSPYFLEIPFAPPADYAARVAHLPYCLLLDSPTAHGGRYAYLAFSPRHVLTEREGNIYIDNTNPLSHPKDFWTPAFAGDSLGVAAGSGRIPSPRLREDKLRWGPVLLNFQKNSINTIASEDLFTYIKSIQTDFAITPLPFLPPFQTGWAGYIGYDYNSMNKSLNTSINDQPHPTVTLCFYDIVTAFDMQEQRAWVVAHPSVEDAAAKLAAVAACLGGEILEELDPCFRREFALSMQKQLESPAQAGVQQFLNCLVLEPDISPAAYHTAVEKTLAYIRAGDIYQANITQRFSGTLPEELHQDGAALFELYTQIIPLNPAPYSAFFHTPAVSLLSYSPEQFLHVEGNTITTRPIKGTAPRLQDALLDKKQQDLLLHSTKNRAENLMIVDLLRNDLSRVCVAGSVKVEKLYELESFSSVHHLVSTISGTLSDGNTAIDALRHAFPGGSITGAPKIRSMEIIHELEHHARNSYCGTLLYLGCDGSMESSILIRTLVVTAGKMTLHAGCGIVADSDPAAEYAESIAKARVFLEVFGN